MARILHLLKGPNLDHLALTVMAQQRAAGDDVTVALLPGATTDLPADLVGLRVPEALGWETLLERLFEADQVITW
jgi:hypothetical protein